MKQPLWIPLFLLMIFVAAGAVSPAGCGGDGATGGAGTGGAPANTSSGGTPGTGGALTPATGGAPMQATGGMPGTGGSPGSGGLSPDAGASGGAGGVTPLGTGGLAGTGGRASSGGVVGGGGRASSGGVVGGGGRASTGGGGGGGGRGSGGAGAGGASGKITVWMAGDSTMANDGGTTCPIGWGTQFQPLFNGNVTVANNAKAGTSIDSWLYTPLSTSNAAGDCDLTLDASGKPVLQARWQSTLDGMKPGDFLLIEFGINDGGSCPRYETDTGFKASLAMMAQAALDRGATPIFLTPTSSISCKGSTAQGTRGRFVTDTIDAGTQLGVAVVNVHQLTVDLYNANMFCPLADGATDVSATTGGAAGAFFCDDHTHFDMSGAVRIAQLVADGIRAQNLPLAAYLK